MAAYASLTGDHNPLHFDAEFVAKTDFEGLMAQGGLATGLLHALVAEDMPGYIGETIRAEATVTRVRASRSIAELAVVVTTVAGDVVLEGDGMVYQAAPSD